MPAKQITAPVTTPQNDLLNFMAWSSGLTGIREQIAVFPVWHIVVVLQSFRRVNKGLRHSGQ